MQKMRHLLFLACVVVAAAGLWHGASAETRFSRSPMTGGHGFNGHGFSGMRNHGFNNHGFTNHGFTNHGFTNHGFTNHGFTNHGFTNHGFTNHGFNNQRFNRYPGMGGQHFGRDHRLGGQFGHTFPRGPNTGIMGRNGLLRRPFPGEAGFTGLPPEGETRFIPSEMVVHIGPDVSRQTLDDAARQLGLTAISSQELALDGGRLVQFRVTRGDVNDAIRTLESHKIGIAQPNYVFQLQQDVQMAALPPPPNGDPLQYVIDKLHLHEAHTIASGNNIIVAVIDSLVDAAHPDLAGSIIGQYNAVSANDQPDDHGTGMIGAIAAHRRLLGVAPHARILAIHAFSPDAKHPQQATTQSIVAGIDWAIKRGARVINMSFAGPYDPLLQVALKTAHDKGVVLIAAAGNMGPQSAPLYPAADENVIAVTAIDDKDKLLPQANQGPHVALASPGVNVFEDAPHGGYNYTTGTSVAAAHVSGVAALLLERNPGLDVAKLEQILFSTARDLGPPGRDPQFGYGLVDPYRALSALDPAIASTRGAPETTASADPRRLTTTPPPGAKTPGGGPATTAALPPPPPGNDDEARVLEKKRQACRQAGADQGVAAAELADYVDECVSEARHACLKQAVAQKVPVLGRRDFLNRCLQGS